MCRANNVEMQVNETEPECELLKRLARTALNSLKPPNPNVKRMMQVIINLIQNHNAEILSSLDISYNSAAIKRAYGASLMEARFDK